MKKRLLLFILTLLQILASSDTFAHDIYVDNSDGKRIYYSYKNNGTELAVSYAGPGFTSYSNEYKGIIVIPESVTYFGKTYPVTSIDDNAFRGCSNLNKVIIPSSIKTIGQCAFYECTGLTSVTISQFLTSMGGLAFYGCDNLSNIFVSITNYSSFCNNQLASLIRASTSKSFCYILIDNNGNEIKNFTIPDGVTSIGDYAFQNCIGITSIIIPYSVKNIGNGAFSGCSGITTITIPSSVTTIGKNAFYHCIGLVSMKIPDSVTNIDNCTFDGCSGLLSVTIPNSVTSIGNSAFANCSSLTSMEIPSSVTSIGNSAFANCSSLTSMEIPSSVTSIEGYTFSGCSNLGSITIPYTIISMGSKAFYNCLGLSSVHVSDLAAWCFISFTDIYSNPLFYAHHLYLDGEEIINLSIPNNVTIIKNYAFNSCNSLATITISNSVESIGSHAFANCTELTDVFCWAENVPSMKDFNNDNTPCSDAFVGSNIGDVALHVPTLSIDAYKAAAPWSRFKSIDAFLKPQHILTYLVDGEEYKSFKIEEGTVIIPEAVPTKEGYTFSGWSEIPETMPAHDVTVTGTFTINKYKLTYVLDGAKYKSYEVEFGASVKPEPAPTKEGYTFSGWSEIPETMPAHDVTVMGIFSKGSYKLIYLVDNEVYKTVSYDYGATITPEAALTKEGYTFSGWSEIPEKMPAHDVTVTGTFSINKYKLTYTVDGAEYKSYEVEYGATITPEAAPTKEGYTFIGWSEIPKTMPAHDVTVTGSYSVNKYRLTYMLDGAEYKSYEVEYGASITPEPAPTKEGYTFSGWSYIPKKMPAENVTITGTLNPNNYMLIYIVDGEIYKNYEMSCGSPITPEAEPVKEGYTFSGWSWIPSKMPAENVTISGTFSINSYKLTYTVDGEEYKSYEVEYGTTITPEVAPTKEGYTFSGWSEIPETMPAHDVTITGTFSINSYTLTYMIDDVVYKTVKYEYGATITPEPQPDGDYVEFTWVGLPDKMPAHDVTVTASYVTGIIELLMVPQHNVRVYSTNGKKLDKLQKGLNIVVFGDGIVKKVVVK